MCIYKNICIAIKIRCEGLGKYASVVKDLRLAFRTHLGWLTTTYNSNYRRSDTFYGTPTQTHLPTCRAHTYLEACGCARMRMRMRMHTHTHTIKINIFLKIRLGKDKNLKINLSVGDIQSVVDHEWESCSLRPRMWQWELWVHVGIHLVGIAAGHSGWKVQWAIGWVILIKEREFEDGDEDLGMMKI